MSTRQVKEIVEDLKVCAEQLNDTSQYWKKSVCLDAASAIEMLMGRLDAFVIHGTDGCPKCETGRVTLYHYKNNGCFKCYLDEQHGRQP